MGFTDYTGLSREATEPNTENIFSSNAANVMQYWRLKIEISCSFVLRFNIVYSPNNIHTKISAL